MRRKDHAKQVLHLEKRVRRSSVMDHRSNRALETEAEFQKREHEYTRAQYDASMAGKEVNSAWGKKKQIRNERDRMMELLGQWKPGMLDSKGNIAFTATSKSHVTAINGSVSPSYTR